MLYKKAMTMEASVIIRRNMSSKFFGPLSDYDERQITAILVT